MTVTTSISKKSFFGTHFKNKIKENKKLLIVNSILELIGLPVISIVFIYMMYVKDKKVMYMENCSAIITVSIIAIAISILCGIIFAYFSYKYLFTKSLVDMNYSLPLTGKQRFLADYLSGLTMYMLPVIGTVILSIAILGVGSTIVDMSELWNIFPELLSAGTIVLLAMVMLYTLSVLAIVCCGSSFEAVFSIFAANIIIPASVFCIFISIVETAQFGVSVDSIIYKSLFNATSPVGNIVMFVAFLENAIYTQTGNTVSMYFMWLIPELIFTALYFLGAYILYKRRKAESVSKPYVYKAFYYIIVTFAVFCILSTFITYDWSILAGLITCGILYFLLEVISKRGFKRFWVSILRYAATVAAVVVFCSVCESTNGFGISEYVPRASAVSSVSFDVRGMSNLNIDSCTVYKDENVIKAAVSMQKDIINDYYNNDSGNDDAISYDNIPKDDDTFSLYDYCEFEIVYNMKNGSTVIRRYCRGTEFSDELLTAIMTSDEYAETVSQNMINYNTYDYKSDKNGNPLMRVSIEDKLNRTIDERNISLQKAEDLQAAFKQDLMDMTEEEFKNAPVYCTLNGYAIRETFENTINFLNENDFKDAKLTDESINQIIDDGEINVRVFSNVFTYCNGNDDYIKEDKVFVYSDYINRSYDTYLVKWDVTDIIQAATPIIVGEKPIGAIYFSNSAVLFLRDTPENQKLIDEVVKQQNEKGILVDSDNTYYYDYVD